MAGEEAESRRAGAPPRSRSRPPARVSLERRGAGTATGSRPGATRCAPRRGHSPRSIPRPRCLLRRRSCSLAVPAARAATVEVTRAPCGRSRDRRPAGSRVRHRSDSAPGRAGSPVERGRGVHGRHAAPGPDDGARPRPATLAGRPTRRDAPRADWPPATTPGVGRTDGGTAERLRLRDDPRRSHDDPRDGPRGGRSEGSALPGTLDDARTATRPAGETPSEERSESARPGRRGRPGACGAHERPVGTPLEQSRRNGTPSSFASTANSPSTPTNAERHAFFGRPTTEWR